MPSVTIRTSYMEVTEDEDDGSSREATRQPTITQGPHEILSKAWVRALSILRPEEVAYECKS